MRWLAIHFLSIGKNDSWNNQIIGRIPNELKGNLHQLINVFLSKVEFRHGLRRVIKPLRKKT